MYVCYTYSDTFTYYTYYTYIPMYSIRHFNVKSMFKNKNIHYTHEKQVTNNPKSKKSCGLDSFFNINRMFSKLAQISELLGIYSISSVFGSFKHMYSIILRILVIAVFIFNGSSCF